MASPAVPFALSLPALLGLLGITRLWAKEAGHLEDVDAGEVFSHTSVTAFESVGVGLAFALPLAAFVIAGLGSQSVAAEFGRRTLRNVALRPLSRVALGAGKALALFAAAAVSYGLAVGAALALSSGLFEFGDVVEILEIRSAKSIPMVTAEELTAPFRRMLALAGIPLLGCASLGLFAGTLARNGTRALAIAAGALVSFELVRVIARATGHEHWLLGAYVPSPLADVSVVGALRFAIESPNDDLTGFALHPVAVPLIWTAVLGIAALCMLRRKELR